MSRSILALFLVVALGSCAHKYGSAPNDLNDACAILNERPHYTRAFKAVERKWGVPTHVLMAMIYQESKFISDNKPPHQYVLGIIPAGRQSSAMGYSQALDGTWDEYKQQTGHRGARRDDIDDATDFMGWYITATQRETGVPVWDAKDQYLAYHEGRTGYMRQSYRSKAWLMRVASEVDSRADMYQTQLALCRRFR